MGHIYVRPIPEIGGAAVTWWIPDDPLELSHPVNEILKQSAEIVTLL